MSGKIENLENLPIETDEILLQQSFPGLDILVHGQLDQRTDHVIAVVRKAVSVGGQNQKQIQQDLLLLQGG
jgi:hypothetical protein